MDYLEGSLTTMQAISLQAVVDSGYPAVIRAAASKLMACQYLDVGTFLKELPQSDLEDLTARSARIIAGADSAEDLDSMIILSCMLCQAEGGSLDGTVQSKTSNLIILLSFEDLERKGILEFFREKATLVNETLDEDIARIK